MLKALRREFRLNKFGFHHGNPADFAVWSPLIFWQWKFGHVDGISGYLITYRFFLAALFLAVLVANGTTTAHPEFFFIYLTNLGYLLQTIHLVVSAGVPIHQLLYSRSGGNTVEMGPLTKFSWFLYNATNITTVTISVIYWGALYVGDGLSAMDFLVHGLNSIVSICDIFLSKRPCRLMHFYHPLVVLLTYVAFSSIYWAAGGRNEDGLSYIYPILDWENLNLTIPFLCIGFFVALPIAQFLIWIMHQLRNRIFSTAGKIEDNDAMVVEGRINMVYEDDRYF